MTQEKIIIKKNKKYKVIQEIKMYRQKREHLDLKGHPYCYIDCPFCGHLILTNIWSLKITNKKCQCGALHTRYGNSIKIIEQTLLKDK